ncbi:pre-toxin TG domain-containing protein [Desmospora activa]|uniref:tRNA-specific A34 adenosine deaminase n=1 Tax=Desmospora activa DSM 45169 TaxID=1121389 RepID=A0A2T4Z6L8_9BACL|nr:pre-toxin TG domain-containing protein [Desmospora activa]PTM57535.1 tRNA-specific A34 adenosine deaminase [Desmospora activa DSM 45169]
MKGREISKPSDTEQKRYNYTLYFLMILLLSIVFILLLPPDIAQAHNCGDFRDCYSTLRAAVAATLGLSMFAVMLSIGLDFVPIVGQTKGMIEAISGRDLITGEELEDHVRLLGILGPAGRIAGGAASVGRGASHFSKAESGYIEIQRFRRILNMPRYSLTNGRTGTVARVEVNGRRIFGVNTSLIKNSKYAPRDMDLRRRWLREVNWVPPKKNKPNHLGHAQSLSHAESHALIRAYERMERLGGQLPKKLTMVVDRPTCNICRGEMPALLKRLGIEELTIYSGGRDAIIIKAIK